MDLAKGCYLTGRKLPREERYGLISQIRRAAASVPANIAEGSGRTTKKDFVNVLRIAQGSLRELETYILLTREVELMKEDDVAPLLEQVSSVGRLLNRLIQSLQPPT
jgi:four helix bundle protein